MSTPICHIGTFILRELTRSAPHLYILYMETVGVPCSSGVGTGAEGGAVAAGSGGRGGDEVATLRERLRLAEVHAQRAAQSIEQLRIEVARRDLIITQLQTALAGDVSSRVDPLPPPPRVHLPPRTPMWWERELRSREEHRQEPHA